MPLSGRTRAGDPLIGVNLSGGFLVVERLFEGATGLLYRAEQRMLGRSVAVKMIHSSLTHDNEAVMRFVTGARAASQLSHPNIVTVLDFGEHAGQLYLIMELLTGKTLARELEAATPLPVKQALDISSQVLAAAADAHHQGIVHRDLSPRNIMLEPRREGLEMVKVVDFGVAKIGESTRMTRPGQVFGSPEYMSPEQAMGRTIDACSDIYTCGAVLYRMLVGRPPFEGEKLGDMLGPLLRDAPVPPHEAAPSGTVSKALSEVVLTALAKEPEDRWQSAEAFSEALLNSVAGPSVVLPKGVALPRALCGKCHAAVPFGKKFCGACGAAVGARIGGAPTMSMPAPALDELVPPTQPELSPLLDREADLRWLQERQESTRDPWVALSVVGETGIGKTRLLTELVESARRAGATVVLAGPDPWRARVRSWALRESISGLAALPRSGGSPDDWGEVSEDVRLGLREVFGRGAATRPGGAPVWDSLIPGSERKSSSHDYRKHVVAAVRWALQRAVVRAGSAQVLWLIDDIDHCDQATCYVIEDLAERPLGGFTLVTSHVEAWRRGWPADSRVLAPLSESSAERLCPEHGLPSESRTPMVLEQHARMGRRAVESMTMGKRDALGDLVTHRIALLPVDARRALGAIAVQCDGTRETLEPTLVDVEDFDECVTVLEASGFVESVGRCLRITHPLVREIVLTGLPAGVRMNAYRAASQERANFGAPLPLEVQADWALHGQWSFQALMMLEQLATRAHEARMLHDAVRHLRAGADLARRELTRGEIDNPMEALRLFNRKLGDTLIKMHDYSDAEGVLREALDLEARAGSERAHLLASLALVTHERGRHEDARNLNRLALERAEKDDDRELVSSLHRMKASWG